MRDPINPDHCLRGMARKSHRDSRRRSGSGKSTFEPTHLSAFQGLPVLMREDPELCTYVRHHQQKLVLFLAAMREYADEAAGTRLSGALRRTIA